MSYFCYIHSPGSGVPHMEAFESRSLEEAKARARRLMLEHSRAERVELFDGDRKVAAMSRGGEDEREAEA